MQAHLSVQPDIRAEHVVYQNPLLFLKIWEIHHQEPHEDVALETLELDPWHYHKEVEFLAIVEGRLGVQTKHEYIQLGPGDVMLLGASQLHRTHPASSAEPLRYVVFQVDLAQHFDPSSLHYLSVFSELTRPLSRLNYIFRKHEAARRNAHALVLSIYAESLEQARGYELAVSSSIKQLLLLMLRFDTHRELGDVQEADLVRLRPALDYVERHLKEKITVEDVCCQLHLSYHYFIKLFKKVIGLSFIDYVNYKRIKTAERLLLTQDLSVSEIGEQVGIPNMAQFYKLFKRHNHCSPKEFKQRMKSSGSPADSETAAGLA